MNERWQERNWILCNISNGDNVKLLKELIEDKTVEADDHLGTNSTSIVEAPESLTKIASTRTANITNVARLIAPNT